MGLYWRLLRIEDYDLLCEWGKFWRFPLPPIDFLPNDGLCLGGLMVCDSDGNPLCAGFIYETNSSVCWMEYIVSNPEVKNKELRRESLNSLIEFLTMEATAKGFKYIFTTVKNKNLINKYLDNGFTIGSENTTEMIKIL